MKAKQLHDKLKAEAWHVDKLEERPKYTWQQACVRWVNESSHKKTIDSDIANIRYLDAFLGSKALFEINGDDIESIINKRLEEGVKPATVNRLLGLLRAIFRKALHEWEWLNKHPRIRMLKEPKRRVRFLTHEEAKSLLNELPTHLEAMVSFSLATGLRKSNVTNLRWNQVNLDKKHAWVNAEEAKAGNAIPVPLNELAMQVLNAQLGNHEEYVFVYKGKPIKNVNTKAFKAALKRAGINNFRWHDLRHCWASWHAMAGTPLNVLQELGSWKSGDMVRRYAHLSSEHLQQYAENLPKL